MDKEIILNLTQSPGVYLMKNTEGEIIYVGKAKNINKRVRSYFYEKTLSPKINALVKNIANIETIITKHEVDALLLEQNLIHKHKPKFNTLLRDDKSYPYIYFSGHKEYPYIATRRQVHGRINKLSGEFVGPYTSMAEVQKIMVTLQKIFKLRTCRDHEFKNRFRACLKYQIKRCSAPCVDMISQSDYQDDLNRAKLFLKGRDDEVMDTLSALMKDAAKNQYFEKAATYRDQLVSLREIIQKKQSIMSSEGEVDIWAIEKYNTVGLLLLMRVRDGKISSQRVFSIKNEWKESDEDLINQFIPQYYLDIQKDDIPHSMLFPCEFDDSPLLQSAIEKYHNRLVYVLNAKSKNIWKQKEEYKNWYTLTLSNAKEQLKIYINDFNEEHLSKLDWENLSLWLGLEKIDRMDCFDISHLLGEATVASCVVFKNGVLAKKHYRTYRIHDISQGDDYGAMEQAIYRRFRDHLEVGFDKTDILVVDGGVGQINSAIKALNSLKYSHKLLVLGVSKGPTRKVGMESLYTFHYDVALPNLEASSSQKTVKPLNNFPKREEVIRLIWHIRDEAHRFALKSQRRFVISNRTRSKLQDLSGIGSKRRKILLEYFGSIAVLKNAKIDDIAKIKGIGKKMAQQIYDNLH